MKASSYRIEEDNRDKKDYYFDVKIPSYQKWIAKRVVKKELSKIL